MAWYTTYLIKQAVNVSRMLRRSPAAIARLAAAPAMHGDLSPEVNVQRELAQQVKQHGIASRWENLPPLQQNYMRLIHRTSPRAASRILAGGENLQTPGPWSSTATGHSADSMPSLTELSARGDPRFNAHGNRAMIYDVPLDVHRAQSNVLGSGIPARYLVGATDMGQSRKAMALGLGNKIGLRPDAPKALPSELVRPQATLRGWLGRGNDPVSMPQPSPSGSSIADDIF